MARLLRILGICAAVLWLLSSTIYAQQPPMPATPVTLDLYQEDVRAVLRWFQDESGINLVLDDTVQGTVTLMLDEVPLDDAFVAVLAAAGLGWEVIGETVLVSR